MRPAADSARRRRGGCCAPPAASRCRRRLAMVRLRRDDGMRRSSACRPSPSLANITTRRSCGPQPPRPADAAARPARATHAARRSASTPWCPARPPDATRSIERAIDRSRASWIRTMPGSCVAGSKLQWPCAPRRPLRRGSRSSTRASSEVSRIAARIASRGRLPPHTGTPARTAFITTVAYCAHGQPCHCNACAPAPAGVARQGRGGVRRFGHLQHHGGQPAGVRPGFALRRPPGAAGRAGRAVRRKSAAAPRRPTAGRRQAAAVAQKLRQRQDAHRYAAVCAGFRPHASP